MVKPIVVAFAAYSVSSCVLLCVFDAFCAALGGLFLLHRVGHWWCTYLLLMQLYLLEIPTGQRVWSDVGIHLVLRLAIVWNATVGLPCFMKQDRWAAIKPWV